MVASTGNVKLLFPNPVNESYKQYFVNMAHSDIPLQGVSTNPELLPVPSSRNFKVLVEHVSLSWFSPCEVSLTPSSLSPTNWTPTPPRLCPPASATHRNGPHPQVIPNDHSRKREGEPKSLVRINPKMNDREKVMPRRRTLSGYENKPRPVLDTKTSVLIVAES